MGGPNGKYLGITRWRFYIKCTHCSRPLTFLTDPKNADYEMESGGTRNYEMQKDKAATEEDAAAEQEEQEKLDPMKALENRVLESQQEMADLDNLEEIKAMNARHVKLLSGKNTKEIVGKIDDDEEEDVKLTAEDEALVQSIQFGKKPAAVEIMRLNQDDERRIEEERQRAADELAEKQRKLDASAQKSKPAIPIVFKKKRRRTAGEDDDSGNKKPAAVPIEAAPSTAAGLDSLLGGYGSDSSDD